MNAKSQFEIETAIQDWRRAFKCDKSLSADNIDEFESHLRDAIDDLMEEGLGSEEAFAMATKRLGVTATPNEDAATTLPESIAPLPPWIETLKWAICGAVSLSAAPFLLQQFHALAFESGFQSVQAGVPLSLAVFTQSAAVFFSLMLIAFTVQSVRANRNISGVIQSLARIMLLVIIGFLLIEYTRTSVYNPLPSGEPSTIYWCHAMTLQLLNVIAPLIFLLTCFGCAIWFRDLVLFHARDEPRTA
jgi:hypothetical protein